MCLYSIVPRGKVSRESNYKLTSPFVRCHGHLLRRDKSLGQDLEVALELGADPAPILTRVVSAVSKGRERIGLNNAQVKAFRRSCERLHRFQPRV
jgi:hypothetical protein